MGSGSRQAGALEPDSESRVGRRHQLATSCSPGSQLLLTLRPLPVWIQVVPCLAIHDTMRHVKSDVGTVGFGGCMGMSGFLLAVGKKVGGGKGRGSLSASCSRQAALGGCRRCIG